MTEVRRPDLSRSPYISVDIETHDPGLKELGPGVYRGDGRILGVAISDGTFSEYYNVGHYDCSPDERDKNVRYLRKTLGTSQLKIGQHLIYDLDWLENGEYKMRVNGPLASVEVAEALIDETQMEYNLNFIANKYKIGQKHDIEVKKFCADNGWRGDYAAWLHKMPWKVVRAYGVGDANLPIKIWLKQRPILESQELLTLFELENELTRCLVLFRKTGVLIDQNKRDKNGLMIQNKIELMERALFTEYGKFNYNSTQQVARIFDLVGIKYDRTEQGNPTIRDSFYKRWKDEHDVVNRIYELRRHKRHLDTFIMGSHVKFVGPDGLMHPQFFNTRNNYLGGLKGTRSGRLSGANPNLQQQPAKGVDEYWGQLCREDFIPFPDSWWLKIDYSQIEYRFMAHFAVGPGSDELRTAYNTHPDVDYHQYIIDLTGLKRRYAKNLNFGVAYGMGARKMAEMFGWDLDYCYDILEIYHDRAPYVRATVSKVEQVARRRGYIKTFLKRRSHLVSPDKAYTMYCRLIQGSAADLMKKAMVECYKSGVWDVLSPHVTVHDELGSSMPKTREGIEAGREQQKIMEECIKIRVPIKADAEVGPTWADVKEFEWDELLREVS